MLFVIDHAKRFDVICSVLACSRTAPKVLILLWGPFVKGRCRVRPEKGRHMACPEHNNKWLWKKIMWLKTIINHPPNAHFYRCYKPFPNGWFIALFYPHYSWSLVRVLYVSICELQTKPTPKNIRRNLFSDLNLPSLVRDILASTVPSYSIPRAPADHIELHISRGAHIKLIHGQKGPQSQSCAGSLRTYPPLLPAGWDRVEESLWSHQFP